MDILRTHYTAVLALADFLGFDASSDRGLAAGFVVGLAGSAADAAPLECSEGSQGEHSQGEVVSRAIEALLARSHARHSRPPHALALGFRPLSDNSTAVAGMHGVENPHPNSLVALLKCGNWQRLLDRIGPRAMTHLLLNTSVFCELPNNCFLQITGPIIVELPNPSPEFTRLWLKTLQTKNCTDSKKRLATEDLGCIQPLKKHKPIIRESSNLTKDTIQPKENPNSLKLTNHQVLIPRFKLFYKRPIHTVNGRITHGLPRNHLLNRFSECQYAFYLVQTIFPRQFNLGSPFTTPKYQPLSIMSKVQLQSVMERNPKITKIPWRLTAAAQLMKLLQSLHNKCDYRSILHRQCPRQVRHDNPQTEWNVLEMCVPHECVTRFVRSAIRHVVPHAFWGSMENENIFLDAVENFIRLQRFESFTLDFIMRGIKVSSCEWLIPPSYGKSPPKHVPPTDSQKRLEIFSEFVYWMMAEYVIPLINSNFYVTESTAHKNRIFYFRHEDWVEMTAPMWKKLGHSTYKPLDVGISTLMKSRTLSFSYVRLLPKGTSGFRPITNLRRRIIPRGTSPKDAKYCQSINSILQNSFQVLKYESIGTLKGTATVSGLSDIYPRLKNFQARIKIVRPKKLYFVKADIVACFDTINQTMLMDILKTIIKEEEYLVQKYSITFASVGKIKRDFSKRAQGSDDFMQFSILAKQLANNLRNAIITDGVVFSLEDREDLIALLEEHICNNLVKMGKKYYQQILGIPQGSVLSSLLCSFFLAHMERKKVRHLVSKNDLLLRLVDDFLFITPSIEKATEFVKLLHQGISDYGCSVNPAKTVVNFDIVDSGVTLKRVEDLSVLKNPRDFPWCGLLIDMKTLHVEVDYTRLSGSHINESLSIEYSRKPWTALQLKMFHYIIPKCHSIFLDPILNSETTVLLNIYQNFLICAMKLYCHVKAMVGMLRCPIPTTEFLMNVIRTTITYTKGLVFSRMKKVGELAFGKIVLCLLKVEWLGLRAFARVLKRKQSSFKLLLKELNTTQNHEKFNPVRKKLQAVSCHSQSKLLDSILY